MADLDPRTWSRFTLALYALGVVYLLGFFAFFTAFHLAEDKARGGDPAAVARYNRSLRGFPNAFYAKMLGRRPLEPERPKGPAP